MSCAPLLLTLWLLVLAPQANGQEGSSLRSVKRIFIEGLGDKPALREIKKDLQAELRRSEIFGLADSADQADATLTGRGDTWLKGYYSLNPRAGTSPANGQPVYGGYVSVELKDRAGVTVWSYLATPHASSKNIARELSKDVVKHLVSSYTGQAKH
jgi:phosphate transport system substrate-binding protein